LRNNPSRIVLIRAQKLRNKTISCIGQTTTQAEHDDVSIGAEEAAEPTC